MKNKISAGQVVYVRQINGRGKSPELWEETVLKSGNKYFDFGKHWLGKFSIETLFQVTNFTPSYRVYLSKQDYELEVERDRLTDSIRDRAGKYGKLNLPIEVLREVDRLLTPT